MDTSENFYDANLYTSSYIELETNTILLARGHNSCNRTIQVVPLVKEIHVRFSIFYDSTQTAIVPSDKKIIYIVMF
jgi:hypothetical protein